MSTIYVLVKKKKFVRINIALRIRVQKWTYFQIFSNKRLRPESFYPTQRLSGIVIDSNIRKVSNTENQVVNCMILGTLQRYFVSAGLVISCKETIALLIEFLNSLARKLMCESNFQELNIDVYFGPLNEYSFKCVNLRVLLSEYQFAVELCWIQGTIYSVCKAGFNFWSAASG